MTDVRQLKQRVSLQSNIRFFGNLVINYTEKTVRCGDETLDLTRKEYSIVELLSLNTGQVFDKERIYEKIWGYDAEGDSRSAEYITI